MISRYYHTLCHLKPIQVRYQLYYRIRKKFRKLTGFRYPLSINKEGNPIKLKTFINRDKSFSNYQFSFLKQTKAFSKENIDWNYSGYGKLWTYNLNYFDFLLQSDMEPRTGMKLIEDFISKLTTNSIGLEPYPISLRAINWIKFISKFSSSHLHIFSRSQLHTLSSSLYAQYQILLDTPEYHLLGNHLLENGFALLFGAFYFKDGKLYSKARKILTRQLNEQLLDDGAHFELSPMYQQILLERLLDCCNLVVINNELFYDKEFNALLYEKAEKLLNWLKNMTFSNGDIPYVNDAAPGIAPSTKQLEDYGETLDVFPKDIDNTESSGYKLIRKKNYELFLDVANIKSDYQPGHTHADTFNFILYYKGMPVIVDTGTSTYNKSDRRHHERSVQAHNTVMVHNQNMHEVWGGFRVARRAKIVDYNAQGGKILSTHDGFKNLGIHHQRIFEYKENQVKITDNLLGSSESKGVAFLHFHPDIKELSIEDNTIKLLDLTIIFQNSVQINSEDYLFAEAFNKLVKAKSVQVEFVDQLITHIELQ